MSSWIKMKTSLRDCPKVDKIIDHVDGCEALVIGGLFIFWSIADAHTEDGNLPDMSKDMVDRKTGIKGFSDALISVGWMEETTDGIKIPEFEIHNGSSAKKRANTAKRNANYKAKKQSKVATVTEESEPLNESANAGASPRIEEIREEKNIIPPNPQGDGAEIPSLEEVLEYMIPKMIQLNSEWTEGKATKPITLKYETCIGNKWRDGFNKPIKSWKLKFPNMLKNEIPWKYTDESGSKPPKADEVLPHNDF